MHAAKTGWNEEGRGRQGTPLLERLLGIASNSFVLAILGALVTYYVGPAFQRRYDEHSRRKAAAQECFTEFLKYSASPFEEYYVTLPISTRSHVTDKEYDEYLQKIAEVHLRRYQTYARVQGLLSVLADRPSGPDAAKAVKQYAISVREFSDAMDKWLGHAHCEPSCVDESKPGASVLELYEEMHRRLHALEHQEEDSSKLILQAGGE